jgi:hypothetical protein
MDKNQQRKKQAVSAMMRTKQLGRRYCQDDLFEQQLPMIDLLASRSSNRIINF